MDLSKINRVEVIDESGRAYTNYSVDKCELSLQDDDRTLKVFVKKISQVCIRYEVDKMKGNCMTVCRAYSDVMVGSGYCQDCKYLVNINKDIQIVTCKHP